MASQGPLYPGTRADDSAVGTITWTSPTNIGADDTNYAFAETFSSSEITHYLKATNFGFTIPSGATIDGIVVEIARAQQFADFSDVADSVVRLVKAGVVVGDNKANEDTGSWPTSTITNADYGGSTTLWGQTWTDSQINASNFGVVLAAELFSDTIDPAQAFVDYIRVTVYYTVASANLTEINGVATSTISAINGQTYSGLSHINGIAK